LFSTRERNLDYIEPTCFPKVLETMETSRLHLEGCQERNITFPVVESLMGSGKSTLGAEITKRFASDVSKKKEIPVATGFIRANHLYQVDGELGPECVDVAIRLVTMSLLDLEGSKVTSVTKDEVLTKLQSDLGTNVVVLHIDEYQRDKDAVKKLWMGCIELAMAKGRSLLFR